MITLSQPGLHAAIAELRTLLAAKSTMWINYNNQLSDQEVLTDVTLVLTAYLNAAQPPKGPSK